MRVGGDVCNFVIKCYDCNIIFGLLKKFELGIRIIINYRYLYYCDYLVL